LGAGKEKGTTTGRLGGAKEKTQHIRLGNVEHQKKYGRKKSSEKDTQGLCTLPQFITVSSFKKKGSNKIRPFSSKNDKDL